MIRKFDQEAEEILEYDTITNFDPKSYSTTQDWLDDSINQFLYEEDEFTLMVATFLEEDKK